MKDAAPEGTVARAFLCATSRRQAVATRRSIATYEAAQGAWAQIRAAAPVVYQPAVNGGVAFGGRAGANAEPFPRRLDARSIVAARATTASALMTCLAGRLARRSGHLALSGQHERHDREQDNP